jgi:hypothetical protein
MMPPWLVEVMATAPQQYVDAQVADAVVTDRLEKLRKRAEEHHPDDRELIKDLHLLETFTQMLADAAVESVAIPEEKFAVLDAQVAEIIPDILNDLPSETIDRDCGLCPTELQREGDSINGETTNDFDNDSDEEYQQDRSPSVSGGRGKRGSQRQEKVRWSCR